MSKCPNCGNSGIFLRTEKCIICGNRGCDKCMSYVLTVDGNDFTEDLWCCSEKCYLTFEKKLEDHLPISEIIGTDPGAVGQSLWGKACLQVLTEINPKLAKKFKKQRGWNHVDGYRVIEYKYIQPKSYGGKHRSDMRDRFYAHAYLVLANNLETAGRQLDAAEIYESLQMYEKARKLREKEKQVIVKRTDISVDLNKLIQQIRDGGIVVVYRCPHCGGKLKIGKDTSVDSLKVCEHCGLEIETMELADFLRTALS